MIDLSQAKRSEVLKLQLEYNDILLFRQLASTVYQKKDKLPPHIVSQLAKTINDMEILLQVMREEGSIE